MRNVYQNGVFIARSEVLVCTRFYKDVKIITLQLHLSRHRLLNGRTFGTLWLHLDLCLKYSAFISRKFLRAISCGTVIKSGLFPILFLHFQLTLNSLVWCFSGSYEGFNVNKNYYFCCHHYCRSTRDSLLPWNNTI